MLKARLPDDLNERLKGIAQLRPELDVTQLQIINLEDVRAAYGDKWPGTRQRVFEVAINFLKKRITPEDLLIPCGDGFIVVFGSVEGASAEIAGLQLARSLSNHFRMEAGFEQLRFRCKHQTLEIAGIANLVRALSVVEPAEPIHGTFAEDDTQDKEIRFKFQPLWDAKHEAISTYVARAYDMRGRPLDDEEQNGASPVRGHLSRDLAAIEASASALDRLLKRGEQAIVGFTLQASTLADHDQLRNILQALEAISQRKRRYLMIVLGDVVPGFPRYHLDRLVQLLSHKVERIVIELSFDEPDIGSVAGTAAWGFGYSLPRRNQLLETTPSVLPRVARDAKRAARHGKRLIVGCDRQPELVSGCRAAGAHYVACRALWPVLDVPRGVERAELSGIAAA